MNLPSIELGPNGVPIGYERVSVVAEQYGVRVRTIHNRAYRGEIETLKVGHAIFVKLEGLEAALAGLSPRPHLRFKYGPRK